MKYAYDRCCSRISMIGLSSHKGEIRSQRRTLTLYASEVAFLQKACNTSHLCPCSSPCCLTDMQLHMAILKQHSNNCTAINLPPCGIQAGYSAQVSSQLPLAARLASGWASQMEACTIHFTPAQWNTGHLEWAPSCTLLRPCVERGTSLSDGVFQS